LLGSSRVAAEASIVICTGIIFPTASPLKEQVMSLKPYSLSKRLAIAGALAFGISGIALADDSSMNPFTGDFYGELHRGQVLGNSNLVRAPKPPASDAMAECASPGAKTISWAQRKLALTPTPIFSDKGV
jgi:hypothetical protein